MSVETTIENTETSIEVPKKAAAPKKSAVKKVVAKKTAAKKAAVKKVAAKKVKVKEISRFEELKGKVTGARGKVEVEGKRLGLAYAGVLGTAYDQAAERFESVSKSSNTQYDKFITRGEKLRDKAQEKFDGVDLPKDFSSVKESLEGKIEDLNLPKDLDSAKEKATDIFEGIKSKFKTSEKSAA